MYQVAAEAYMLAVLKQKVCEVLPRKLSNVIKDLRGICPMPGEYIANIKL
jgi:hypothetical protein